MNATARQFSLTRFGEARTGGGQLLSFECHPDDVEKVKEALKLVRRFDVPASHKANPSHGTYGRYSRYRLKQHKYAGGGHPGCGGYIEVLTVRKPPDGRHGIVLYEWTSKGDSAFWEFETLRHAKLAFNRYWSNPSRLRTSAYDQVRGLVRRVDCGLLTPWFYAIGDQELIGDYAFPEGLQNDPVYQFGRQFIVYENGAPMIKTCMGAVTETEEVSYGKKASYRVISWDDGTVWNEYRSSTARPRPLEEKEQWAVKAMDEFRQGLAGNLSRFAINFTDGRSFIGSLREPKGKRSTPEGRYFLSILFENGEKREGWVDFTPSHDTPNLFDYVRKKLEAAGNTVASIEITRRRVKAKGKKWAGIFYGPPQLTVVKE